MNLLKEIDKYKELLDRKAELKKLTDENDAAVAAQKKAVSQLMIDEECASIDRCGFRYSLKAKTHYNKRSEKYLLENGLDFFGILRSEGLGDLIKETVNSNSLGAAVKNYVEENGELSPELESVLTVYEDIDVSRKEVKK